MKLIAMLFSVGVLTTLAVPTEGRAQEEFGTGSGCGGWQEGCVDGNHKLPSSVGPENLYPHDGCTTCPPGTPCHPICGLFLVSAEQKLNYQAMVAAADAGDMSRLLDLAERVPGHLFYNPGRRAVQLVACSRNSIVASLPVRTSGLLARAAALPRSESSKMFASVSRQASSSGRGGTGYPRVAVVGGRGRSNQRE